MIRTLVLLSAYAGLASAATLPGIVSFSSNLVFPGTTPSSIQAGSLQSNTIAIGLVEKVNHTLSQAIPVDAVVNGPALYNSILDLSLPGSTLPVGMRLNSYFFHFDPTNSLLNFTNRNPGVIQIEFQSYMRIAGIQLSFLTLGSSANSQVALPGMAYDNGVLRGLELDLGDWINVVDHRTVQLNLNSSSIAVDQVRILVETPEPASALLLTPAFGLLAWAIRRRSTTARNRS